MEQLSSHLGNSAFVSILIEAPTHKKNIRSLLIVMCLKTSKRKTPLVAPASPTQSIAPGVSRRPLGRQELQPVVGQTCTVLAVTALPPGQEESSESRKIRQDEAGERGVQGSKTGVVEFWKELFPSSCVAVMWQSNTVNTAPVALGTFAQDRPFHQPHQVPWHIK